MTNFAERPLTALDAIYARRSVRAFTDDPVAESAVRALLDAAVQAPTAMHEQPWVFAVVQDTGLLRRLSDHAKAEFIRDAAPPGRLHLPLTSDLHGDFVRQLRDPDFNVFYNAATLVVIGARRTDPFVIADCWLAAENLMLAAAALGLGTCCIGSVVATLNSPAGRADIGLPADVTAVAPIVVGVPAGVPAPTVRREPSVVVWRK